MRQFTADSSSLLLPKIAKLCNSEAEVWTKVVDWVKATRSSWLNCALRDDEAVYSVSIGHFEAVAVGNWLYWINLKYSMPGSVVPLAWQCFELQSSHQLNNIGLSFTSCRNIANQIYVDVQFTWKLNFHPRIKVDLKEKSEVSLASGSSHCLSVGFSLLRNIFFIKQEIIFSFTLVSHTIPLWVHLHLPPPSLLCNYWAWIIVVNVRNVLISLWHCQRKGKLSPLPTIPLYGSESASLASLFLAVGNSMQCIPFSIEVT